MAPDEHDIDLIDQYLDGSLPPAEHAAVEARMQADPAFGEEVAAHRDLRQAVTASGRESARAQVAAAMAAVDAAGGPSHYKPPGKGGFLKSFFLKLIQLGIVGGACFAIWEFGLKDRMNTPAPAQQEATEQVIEQKKIERKTIYRDQDGNEITKEEYEAIKKRVEEQE